MSWRNVWAYYQTETPGIFGGSGYRLHYLTRYLRPGQRVLNVGIGGGVLERLAHERGVDIHTLDPDWASLRHHASENCSHLVVGRLEEIPFAADSLDAVVVSEVLEHLTPDAMRRALREISRVLRPGGRVIGTVPCEENLVDGTVACPHCGEVFHKVGHLQSFSAATMSRALSECFPKPKCFERAFMAKARVGWRERSVDFIRNYLVLTGILTRDKQLVFLGRKAP